MRIPVRVFGDRDYMDDEYDRFGRPIGRGPQWPDLAGGREARFERERREAILRERERMARQEEEDRRAEISEPEPVEETGPEIEPADRDDGGGWKDRYVRLLADYENMKRRTDDERGRLAGVGKEAVLDDVFPLIDHMERAIEAVRDAGGNSGVLEGIELVCRELIKVLEKHGVERVPTVGERFDPKLHEAVAVVENGDADEGAVVEEVKPGFIRNGRLLRPALVVVAK